MESLFNLSSHLASWSFKSHLEGISICTQSFSDVAEIQAPLGNQYNTESRETLGFVEHFCSFISEFQKYSLSNPNHRKNAMHTNANGNVYNKLMNSVYTRQKQDSSNHRSY